MAQLYATSKKEKLAYTYKAWPETFDASLFAEPRPIPDAIAAEFDRMENLSDKLPLRNSEFNEGDFQPGVSNSSIEVATFTLFFSVYCQVVVGREFEMKRNRYNENLPKGTFRDRKGFITRIKQASDGNNSKSTPYNADCANKLCSPCGGNTVSGSTITDETVVTIKSLDDMKSKVKEEFSFVSAGDQVNEEHIEEAQLIATAQPSECSRDVRCVES